jgi:hypothetical protein
VEAAVRWELQLETELECGRLGEPTVRRLDGDGAEPRERLHPDLLAGLEVHDRVVHHPDAVTGHEPLDVSPERQVGVALDLFPAELRGEFGDDPAHHFGRQARASLGDLLDPLHELVGGGALHEVADGTGPQHLEHARAVFIRGEGDHPGPGRHPRDAASRVRPTALRHPDVDEGDIGQVRLGDPDRLLGIRRRADQLDPFLMAEELRECDPEARLVVCEEHPDRIVLAAEMEDGSVRGHRAGRYKREGACSSTWVASLP